MSEDNPLAYSEATKALLKPVEFEDWDRLFIGLEDDDHFIIRPFHKDGIGHYPSWRARSSWIQRIPECKPVGGNGEYLVGATDTTVAVLYSLWKGRISFRDEETEMHFKLLLAFLLNGHTQANIFARYKEGEDLDIADYNLKDSDEFPLIRHQRFALVNSMSTDGYALFKEQGTGKTPVGVATLCNFVERQHVERMQRVIIVCPNNVRLNWQVELAKFSTLKYQCTVLRGTKQVRVEKLLRAFIPTSPDVKATVVIVGYDTLKNSLDYITKVDWDLGICDESHYFKTPGNKRSKAILKLRDICRKRLALTGTPVTNTALDLYMQFEWLGRNYSGFTNYTAFKRFYGTFVQSESGFEKLVGIQNKAFMQERMARLSFIVKKEEALPDLPSKVYDVEEVQMSADQKKVYENVATQLAAEIAGDMEREGNKQLLINNVLTKLLRLAQITSGFVVYPEISDEDGNIEQQRETEYISPNPKLEKLMEILKAKGPNEKTIVWACWTDDIKLISAACKEAGIKAVSYYGSTSFSARAAAVEDFNCDSDTKIFIGNPAAASTGITLLGHDNNNPDDYETNCDHVIYYSQNWSMVFRSQSEDRPHRVGTRCTVRITDLCVPDTIDEQIRDRVLDKITNAMEVSDLREVLNKVL